MTDQPERRPRSQSRKLPLVAGLRVSHDEMNVLKHSAEQHGQTVSNYLRTLVADAIRPDRARV